MKITSIANPPPGRAETATVPQSEPSQPPTQSASPPGFIDFTELSRRIPLCDRSLREAIRKGRIPSIRLPGARRVLFDWESVRAALLRNQREIV